MTTFIPGWNPKPFPTLALSAGGVLALADLHTIAQRTAITGGASWMDSLLLAPGIHYQQAADVLFRKDGASAIVDVVDEMGGSAVALKINNAATASYIQKVAKPGETVTLDVGRVVAARGRYKLHRSDSGNHATAWRESGGSSLGWVSHVLYLSGPVLTLTAIVFVVLFKDWWTLMSIMALMTSRILNIWVIKQRASHGDSPRRDDSSQKSRSRSRSTTRNGEKNSNKPRRRRRLSLSATRQRIVQYLVHLGDSDHKTRVRLRGKVGDIRAITSQTWLRNKTHLEGYLEAAAKLIVYLVAALSGNMTQAGAAIMMVLLLTSAGLLALSNHKAKKMVVNGLAVGVADDSQAATTKSKVGGFSQGASGSSGSSSKQGGRGGGRGVGRSRQDSGGATGAVGNEGGGNPADLAERGQAGHVKWQK
ncbi:hypothetical protein C8A00DRAFT_42065 [Chaetomidium leptoderma]|uniref:Uncharacterized protein n=1 Tax=Chaetomidium leptoderma TaxID=669021 RepID=A0AAN6ZYA4_9PEZI|nr:hypothetical protein C8A00DRAFT_42065 [Chaetomidium leptoderma]